jgi:hypothetical protein
MARSKYSNNKTIATIGYEAQLWQMTDVWTM